jgi:hypothetical protein
VGGYTPPHHIPLETDVNLWNLCSSIAVLFGFAGVGTDNSHKIRIAVFMYLLGENK